MRNTPGTHKFIYLFFLLFFVFFSKKTNAQALTLSLTPSQCFVNGGTNTLSALVSGTVFGANSYSWSVNGPCGAGIASVVPNGSYVTISFSCCGSYSIQCYAISTGTSVIQTSASYSTILLCPPNLTAVASPSTACAGSQASITAGGAVSYTWFPGNFTGSLIVVSPTVATTYTLYGTNSSGCSNISTVTMFVSPLPAITISGNTTICSGSTASLTASGAQTYTWSNSTVNNQIVVSPSTSINYTVLGTNAAGCVNFATQFLTVQSSPSLVILGNPTVCSGSALSLNAFGAQSYTWNTGSNSYSITVTPTVSAYYVVQGNNSNGCTDRDSIFVSVIPFISPNFTFTNFANGQVNFTNTSANTTSNTTYTWNFGNGTSSSGFSTSVTYTTNGIYTVTLTANSGCGPVSITHTVSVNTIAGPSCAASFTYSGNSATGNYTFTSTSGGTTPSTIYNWNFGNTSTYSATGFAGANPPVQTYTNSGTYSVTLTITNTGTFCTSTTSSLVTITVCPISANFSYQTFSTTVNFLNLSTNTLATTTYSWNYGDGSGGPGSSHTYSAFGQYTVTLKATNSASCSASMTKNIFVTSCNLVSNFTHTANTNGVIQFSNTSSNTTGYTNYYWNFGDGVYSLASSPSHTYNNAGTYIVTLKIQDTLSSCNDSLVQSINVTGIACTANSNFTAQQTNIPHYWTATPAYPYNVTSATWYWGDGTQSNSLYSSHLYSVAATYDICLSVTVSCGGSSNYCFPYAVNRANESSSQIVYINVVPPAMSTGIENQVIDNLSYIIYPNPNNGEFTINLERSNDKEILISVYNLVGELVYSSVFGKEDLVLTKTIHIENTARGIYFVKLNSGAKTVTQKIIISD